MGIAAEPHLIRRAIREAECHMEFMELAPFPQDLEEAWGIGDRRDVLLDATFAYSLLAFRRLDEFLKGGRHPDDLSATETGVDVSYVLGDFQALLNPDERTFIDKNVAHLTGSGLVGADYFDEEWFANLEAKRPILERLSEEAARLAKCGAHDA
jgi:hypothetical protein